ncbi:MAG: hypothetical protein Q4G05_01370 [Clostridia bacterium]|nr:hypothetical protein [Clostridia bacterium]
MEEKEELKAGFWLKVLCFFIPFVGLLIYACNVSFNKKYASACGRAAAWGAFWPVFLIVFVAIFAIVLGMGSELVNFIT